jgi:hypothetical protein
MGEHEDRVVVAVGGNLGDVQIMAGRLALGPQLVAAAAEEGDASLEQRLS